VDFPGQVGRHTCRSRTLGHLDEWALVGALAANRYRTLTSVIS
jgi:hypothetical protein